MGGRKGEEGSEGGMESGRRGEGGMGVREEWRVKGRGEGGER